MEKEIDVDGENFGHCSVRSGHGMSMSQETFLMALASRGLISGSAFLFKLKVGFLIQKKKLGFFVLIALLFMWCL